MRAVVAMSGGTDSSVAAALLKEQGHEVIGVTMNLWDAARGQTGNEGGETCSSPVNVRFARRVCDLLEIPFYQLDLKDLFRENVVSPFIEQYLMGRTPNPCILCNNILKFGALLNWGLGRGGDFLATGHYARIEKNDETGQFHLFRGIDSGKDQSYFLFGLTSPSIGKIRFPLGGFKKVDVREMARKLGLVTAENRESQDICFVNDGSYADLVSDDPMLAGIGRGEIVDTLGRVLGFHDGYYRYTIGQRKGLGVAAGERLYVVSLDVDGNRVIVGSRSDLLQSEMIVKDLHVVSGGALEDGGRVSCQVRSRSKAHEATIHAFDAPECLPGARVGVRFSEAQEAITPGQAAVFYRDDEVLGGGWIDEAGPWNG